MINFLIPNLKSQQTNFNRTEARYKTAPTFCAGLNSDTFEKKPTTQTMVLEQGILNALNKDRDKSNRIELSSKTLQETIETFILKEKTPPFTYKLQGDRSFILALRKILLESLNTRSSFKLTVLQDSIMESIADVARNSGFSEITTETEPKEISKDFKKFLGIVYTNEGQDAVYRIIKPSIQKELQTKEPDKLADIITRYNRYESRRYEPLDIYTSMTEDGGYCAAAYFGDDFIAEKLGGTQEMAILNVLHKILGKLGLRRFNSASSSQISQNVPSYAQTNRAEKTLKKIGFLNTTERLNSFNNAELIEALRIVTGKHIDANDSFKFQRLEYLGDAVANNLVSRFLLEKGIQRESGKKIFAEMISNKCYGNYANLLRLPTNDPNRSRQSSNNYYADVFEAFVAAIYNSFPEERVYAFLKPLFEERYQKILSERLNYAEQY